MWLVAWLALGAGLGALGAAVAVLLLARRVVEAAMVEHLETAGKAGAIIGYCTGKVEGRNEAIVDEPDTIPAAARPRNGLRVVK